MCFILFVGLDYILDLFIYRFNLICRFCLIFENQYDFISWFVLARLDYIWFEIHVQLEWGKKLKIATCFLYELHIVMDLDFFFLVNDGYSNDHWKIFHLVIDLMMFMKFFPI